jgi:hypothetical protein
LDAEETLGSSERFGNTTVNVGTLDGGVAANVIAQEAEAQVAVRIAVGRKETGLRIVAKKMEEVVGKVDKEGLRLEKVMGYGPVECQCDVDGEFLYGSCCPLFNEGFAADSDYQALTPWWPAMAPMCPTLMVTTSAICTGRAVSWWPMVRMRR